MNSLKPKKSLGQNFLRSEKAIQDIVKSLEGSTMKNVVEIGGGEGVVTEALLQAGYNVTVIELDSRAAELMTSKFSKEAQAGRFQVLNQDILETSLWSIFNGSYLVVGNIPYYITGLILRHIFSQEVLPEKVTLMVQKEVAERILSAEGKESILSLSVKFYGKPKMVSVVKRGSFVPPPKVDSAIFTVEVLSEKDLLSRIPLEEKFFNLIKAGFKHPRKYALSNIKNYAPDFYESAKENILEKQRAEDVPLDVWLKTLN